MAKKKSKISKKSSKKTSKKTSKKKASEKKDVKKSKKINLPRNLGTVVIVVLLVLLLSYFLFSGERTTETMGEEKVLKEVDPGKILVKVAGTSITQGQLDKEYEQLPPQYKVAVRKEGFLEAMVVQKLLLTEAEKQGITIGEESIDSLIESQAEQAQMDVKQFLDLQAARGSDEQHVRQVVREKLTIDQLIKKITENTSATEEDAKRFYEENPEMFTQKEQIQARHILVKTEEEAKEIKKQLDEGADFAELAKEKSIGPTGPKGGDLGFFSKEMMVLPFSEAAFALEINEISDPVETQFGWHVIQTLARKPGGLAPFEEVKEQLIEHVAKEAKKQAAISYIEELKKTYEIKRFE